MVGGDKAKSWMELCELAASEQDPAKLMALVAEINRLLEADEQHLKAQAPGLLKPPENEKSSPY
jgi:hypothetical protein